MFVHLRVHSEYSIADGLIKVADLVQHAAAAGMPAVAITGRGNLFALIKFYDACRGAGVKPIVGVEMTHRDEDAEPDARYQCVLLAGDEVGYRNLIALVSRAYLVSAQRGCVESRWLAEHSDGVIMLSGALRGDVGAALTRGDRAAARAAAAHWQEVFGDRYYVELQRTHRESEDRYVAAAVDLATELELPVVATNDVCFLARDDFEAHETRICIQEGRTLNDPRRPRRYSEEQYFKSAAEMVELFSDIPEALENSVEIAKRCSAGIRLGRYFLPNYPVPPGHTLNDYLASILSKLKELCV